MNPYLLTTTYSLLTASGLVALTRWFHPAVFSPHLLALLLAATVTAATLHLWNHD